MLVACHLVPALAALLAWAPGPVDDVVPTAIEAVLEQPDDPFFFGEQLLLAANALGTTSLMGTGRCLADVGDVTGDGRADFAVGLQPGAAGDSLQVRDGVTAELVWSADPGGGFRSLRALDAAGGRLAIGSSSDRARVEVRDAATGALAWARDLTQTEAKGPANISSVSWTVDVDGDRVPDVVVAGGGGVHAVFTLSGADGCTVWHHAAGDVAYDARPAHDLDTDGKPEVVVSGGDATPFARLLSGADGTVTWDTPLDGPGSVVLPLDDVGTDDTPDVAVGQFASPGACLLALDGMDGSRLWEADSIQDDVTSLALIGDMQGTGLRDIVVGSFDNAVSGVFALNGIRQWRREVTTNNGAMIFSVAVPGDLDGNGSLDVLAACQDHHVYLLGGNAGQFMASFNTAHRVAAVAALTDGDGDGRAETLAAGVRRQVVLDGAAGLATGPLLQVDPPRSLGVLTRVTIWGYPTTAVTLFGSLGTGTTQLPGVVGAFKLDLATLLQLYSATTPGAGATVLNLEPLPRSLVGFEIYLQAVTFYDPSYGIMSNVERFLVVP